VLEAPTGGLDTNILETHFSVCRAETIIIVGGTGEAMAAAEMAIGSSGATTGIEVIELIYLKLMTAATEKANKVFFAYQVPKS
jgi:hypothetical protein